MEALSSHSDGTLTVIKEKSPTSFEVAQTVQTMRLAAPPAKSDPVKIQPRSAS